MFYNYLLNLSYFQTDKYRIVISQYKDCTKVYGQMLWAVCLADKIINPHYSSLLQKFNYWGNIVIDA